MNTGVGDRVKAVLFDLDDTLFDHQHAARCVLEELRSMHPSLMAHSLEFLETEDFRLLGEMHASVLAGLIDVAEARAQRAISLFAACGEQITADYARRLAERRQMIYQASRRAVPGAIPLLRMLKDHVRIGIVTNNFTNEQLDKMEACALTPLIDVLVTSEEVRYTKPAAEIFHAALDRLGCTPGEAVMVGDLWHIDIVGAQNAGIRAVWFNRRGLARPIPQNVLEISSFEPPHLVAVEILESRNQNPEFLDRHHV